MRKAFSLIEVLVAVALAGAIAFFTISFIDAASLSKESIKTELKAHLNLITSIVLRCKDLSNSMPTQTGATPANATLLSTLECNTSPTYNIDGGQGAFVPVALRGFSAYTATQSGDAFFITTTTPVTSRNYEVLQDLNTSYSSNQYLLTNDTTTATLNFYISR